MSKYFISILLLCLTIASCFKPTDPDTTGSISGTVRDAVTQSFLPNVSISVSNGPTVTTNSAGEYTITGLVPKNYEVVSSKNGYLDNTSSVNVIAGQNINKDIQLIPVMPELTTNISFVNFGTQQNNASIVLSNTGTGQVNWTATTDETWIQVNPQNGSITSGTCPVSVTVNRNGLQPGNYSASVLFTSNVNSVSIAVLLTIPNPNSPLLTVAPTSLNFEIDKEELMLSLVNNGSGTATWSISTNQGWITTNPTSGNTTNETDNVNVAVSRAGLPSGIYNGDIIISTNRIQLSIPVVMEVTTQPSISVNPNNLDFGEDDTSLQLHISNIGSGSLNWSISDNADWLSTQPSSGSGNGVVNVVVNRSGLVVGSYNGSVLILSNGGNRTILVNMSVQNSLPNGVTMLMAYMLNQNSAQLNWTRFIDAGFVSYKVYRGTTPDVSNTNGTLVTEISVSNQTSCISSNLQPSTQYYFRVYVKNQQNQMIPSTNVLSVNTPPLIGNWYVSQTVSGLTGVDFLSPNFGMAAGTSGTYSYSGGNWIQENNFSSKQIAVNNAINIYTNKYFYNGITWTALPFTYGESVTAIDNNNIWVGGSSGKINYYNGSSWVLTQLDYGTIRAIKAVSQNLVYAVDSNGKVLKYNGAGWMQIHDFAFPQYSYRYISDIDVHGDGELWLTYYQINAYSEDTGGKIFRFVNDTLQQEWTLDNGVKCVSSLSNNDVWFGGKSGLIWHYDGYNLLQVSSSCTFEINDLVMLSPQLGWAVGSNGVLKYVFGRK